MRVISSLYLFFILLNFVYSQNSTPLNTSSPAICPVELSSLLKPVHISLPTCSLSSRPADPPPEFLSFEEWKAKQLAEQESLHSERNSHPTPPIHPVGANQDSKIEAQTFQASNKFTGSKQENILDDHVNASTGANSIEPAASSPRSHIPLIDRFNYASDECNARIQSSHKSAKSPSSILSRKKDRYMLSPCRTNKEQFVIVELCEDIRIDTVQLANFEFFSGVFKDIRVSVAHTYTTDGQGWVTVGEYTAKNIRGVQSFHPHKELLPFYRYIRIDFLSYYGSEYFCPISVLRVYGLTQMEEWKLDVWKAEWEASQIASSGPASVVSDIVILDSNTTSTTTEGDVNNDKSEVNQTGTTHVIDMEELPTSEDDTQVKERTTATKDIIEPGMTEFYSLPTTTDVAEAVDGTALIMTEDSDSEEQGNEEMDIPFTTTEDSVIATDYTYDEEEEEDNIRSYSVIYIEIPSTTPSVTSTATATTTLGSKHTVTQTVSTTITLSAAIPSSSPLGSGIPNGESIYRMIMNRLTNLEANHTLYAKYVEEQGRTVNTRLERLEEDIGRLGGIVTSQQQNVAKMLERHKSQIELEHQKLVQQVEHLAHEVLMEKRLGVAQLVLLLAVLVFMALTRGSRGEPLRLSRASAAWHRSLRTSGEWVAGWRSGGVRVDSGPTEASSVSLKDTHSTPALKPAFMARSESSGRRQHSVERKRRSSSRGSMTHSHRDLFQTSQRRPVDFNRSRRSSANSRSRAHTPPRASAPLIETTNSPFKISHPSSSSNVNLLSASNSNTESNLSKTLRNATSQPTRPILPGGWRSGRSISLTGPQEYGGANPGPDGGAGIGSGKKKLAKTSHMHEFKSRSRRGTLDELDASLTLLSPMAEDPSSPFTANEWKKAHASPQTPIKLDNATEISNLISKPINIATPSERIGFGPQVDKDTIQSVGVPFPNPGTDTDAMVYGRDEDMWIDESGSEKAPHEQEASRRSPKGVQRFMSPHRAFAFSSSPSGGKGRFKFRRADASHKTSASIGLTGRE